MRPLARVLVDESHRQAWSTRPEVAARMNRSTADASYAIAASAAVRAGLAGGARGGSTRRHPPVRRRRARPAPLADDVWSTRPVSAVPA